MSIENSIRLIHRVEKLVEGFQKKYSPNKATVLELNKLSESLKKFVAYMGNLDKLQPNYNTNEIDSHIEALNLHLDILKMELENRDFTKLKNGITAIKIMMKFHPTKYNSFTFILAWLLELFYFI